MLGASLDLVRRKQISPISIVRDEDIFFYCFFSFLFFLSKRFRLYIKKKIKVQENFKKVRRKRRLAESITFIFRFGKLKTNYIKIKHFISRFLFLRNYLKRTYTSKSNILLTTIHTSHLILLFAIIILQ